MRRGWKVGAALVVTALLSAVVSHLVRAGLQPGAAPVPTSSDALFGPAPAVQPSAPPSASAALRGVVRDEDGFLIEGAQVHLVAAPVPLSPCESLLQECTCEGYVPFVEGVAAALKPRATATTDAEGRFTIAHPAAPGDRLIAFAELAPDDSGVVLLRNQLAGETRVRHGASLDITVEPGGRQVLGGGAPLPWAVVLGLRDGAVAWSVASDEEGVARLPPVDQLLVLADDHVPAVASGSARVVDVSRGVVFSGVLRGDGRPRAGVRVVAAMDDPAQPCAFAETDAEGRWRLGPVRGSRDYLLSAEAGGHRASVVRHAGHEGGEYDAGLELEEPVTVSGVVKEEKSGRLLPGATVTARTQRDEGRRTFEELDRAQTTTDGAGRFQLTVAAGLVSLEAELRGYAKPRWTLPRAKHLGPGSHEDAWVLTLTQREGVSGLVVDARGRPLEDASVVCRSSSGGDHARTDAQGRFQVDCGTGDVQLTASAQGHLEASVSATSPGAGLVLSLSQGVTVRGRVVDASGLGQRDLLVVVSGEGGMEFGHTGPDGTFAVEALSDGTWEARVEEEAPRTSGSPGGRRKSRRFALLEFDIRGGSAPFLDLRLEPSRSLSGRVVDAQGAPVAGVGVTAVPGVVAPDPGTRPRHPMELALTALAEHNIALRGSGETVSGPDGAFQLEGLGYGPWTLQARAPGVRDDPRSPIVVEGGETGVTLRVTTLPVLAGVVRETSGAPLSDFTVAGRPFSSADGTFSLTLPLAGDLEVAIATNAHVPVYPQVKLRWGERFDVGEVRLSPGRSVKVRVVDAVTEAEVEHPSFLAGTTWLAWDSRTGLMDVPLGAVTLKVSAPERVSTVVPLAGDQASLTVRLGRGAVVSGTWAGPADEELRAVLALPTGKDFALVEGGKFTFRAVPAGRFHLEILRSRDGAAVGEATVTVPPSGETQVRVAPW